jgi:hypothetical protein
VEHFRPKVKFPHLEDVIHNLYLACAICNVLKADDWPAEPVPSHSLASYPDPADTDYNSLLFINQPTYEVASATLAGRYVIERVYLNRAQLVLERRLSMTLAFLEEFEEWVIKTLPIMTREEMQASLKVLRRISKTKTSVIEARPYRDSDTKRRAKPKEDTRR